jgi:5-methyltetrahydropteroyltriglutamate--homocysteine methyltransferase
VFNDDRVLTTHTGSLPRPDELTSMVYDQVDGKPVDADALRSMVDEAVATAVTRQREVGIDIVSDGEMAKPGFMNYQASRLTGFSGEADPFGLLDMDAAPELLVAQYGGEAGAHIKIPKCTGPIAYVGQEAVQADITRFRGALAASGAAAGFLPAISPGCVALFTPDEHYGDYETYLFAIADAMREEYRAIVDAGLMLQIDSPDVPGGKHFSTWSTYVRDHGYAAHVDLHLSALARALEGIPADRVRLHMCWGNYAGPHLMDVALDEVLVPALRLPVGSISFEGANPAHEHEWQLFERIQLPDDKVISPGVIDTKTNVVERPELVCQRIERYAGLVGRERVQPSTDCGFGTFVGFGPVLPAVSWLKLEALAAGARLASERLW